MTRTAPLLTLLAVGVLGGTLFVANTVGLPAPTPAAVTAAAPAPAGSRTDISLSDVPVAGAAQGRTEISLSDIAVAQAPPAQAPGPSDIAYAGHTADRKSTVAVAVKDGTAVAYVCDGAGLEVWLKGPAEGGELALKDKTGTATMSGTAAAGDVSGSVTWKGKDYAYSAPAVDVASAVANGRADVGNVARRAGVGTP